VLLRWYRSRLRELIPPLLEKWERTLDVRVADLLERHHTERFAVLMDQHLPQWRSRRQELNSAPLAYEAWAY
jgi:predicted metal-dependent hydrolase